MTLEVSQNKLTEIKNDVEIKIFIIKNIPNRIVSNSKFKSFIRNSLFNFNLIPNTFI